jgi:anti-sigma factor RsiW
VEGCAACSEYFGQDRVLLDAFHQMRDVRAPLETRRHVFDVLVRARRGAEDPRTSSAPRATAGGWRRVRLWPVLTASLVIGTLAWWLGGEPTPLGREPGAVFVEDYLRRAVGQDHITSSDPDEVRRFLARELGMKIGPIRVDGLELQGAEVCLLDGRRGAMILYTRDGTPVAHYLVPREDATPRAPRLSATEDRSPGGLPVVTWSSSSLEQALVGELGTAQLLALARAGYREG